MTRLCLNSRFVPFRATELKHPVNDAPRIVAVMAPANDDEGR